jgi:hypothetical protein
LTLVEREEISRESLKVKNKETAVVVAALTREILQRRCAAR